MDKKKCLLVAFATLSLAVTLFSVIPVLSVQPYDPWKDVNDDGVIDAKDYQAVKSRIPAIGTPLDKAYLAYDSGWMDIIDKCGKSFNLTHGLGGADLIADIIGKTTVDGGTHQRYLGLTGHTSGWSQCYGYDAFGRCVIQTSDGGYAITGNAWPVSSYDVCMVKTDSAGNMQWNKTYGGADYDCGYSLVQTTDGGYAIAGSTYSFDLGVSDVYLVKTDAAGHMLWNRTYGGADNDYGYSIIQIADGGYLIAGSTYSFGVGAPAFSNLYLVKTDSSGNMQWNKTYGGTEDDYGYSVVQTADGGCAIAGDTYSFGLSYPNAYLVKTDSSGNMQWNKTYGGADYEYGGSVVQTSDGGYAIAGSTYSFGVGAPAFSNLYLVKTDSSGNMQWNKTYGGGYNDFGYSGIQTADGGYALAGLTCSFGLGTPTYCHVYLVKSDSMGNMLWNKTYGGADYDYGYSLVQTADGGYAIAGYTSSFGLGNQIYLVKSDVELGLTWTDSTTNAITLYRGETDPYWNYVRLRLWSLK